MTGQYFVKYHIADERINKYLPVNAEIANSAELTTENIILTLYKHHGALIKPSLFFITSIQKIN